MNDNYWYLKKCDIFHDLAAEQLLLLEQHCHCREFSRGQMVYTLKHTADTVLLLGRGRVRELFIRPPTANRRFWDL